MDVRCDRCGTEYEFDDALVSERGTSVKCTNCSHQFKVYRPRAGGDPDRWVVRVGDGRELAFASLRELQRAILAREVTRGDILSRSGYPTRSLGAIPELTSFFDDADRRSPAPARDRSLTPQGLGLPRATPSEPEASTTQGSIVLPLRSALGAPSVASVGRGDIAAAPTMEQILAADPPTVRLDTDEPPTRRRPPPSEPPPDLYAPAPPEFADMDSRMSIADEPTAYRSSRGGATRWIVAVVMIGTLGVVGATVGRRWIEQQTASGTKPDGSANKRVDDLLSQGERAMNDGDLEAARDLLTKASALSEKETRVHVALARLHALQADVPWLRLRLLAESAKDARALAKVQLGEAASRAKRAADHAAELAPDDPAVARVKVDALRLLDDRGVARSLAPRLSASALTTETAYVLAALDLAEEAPPWPTVLERLRLAASGETQPGRARAALAYALARSGDAKGARGELERMAGAPRPYTLLADLRAFVGGEVAAAAPSASAAKADAGAPTKPVEVGALPQVGGQPREPREPSAGRTPDSAEFSETELQKRLFGDHPAPSGKGKDPPPKKQRPDIDTSDLPGVSPP